ncbi:MAG: hypothetical protein PHP57_11400 [Sideroxydans sp.]|nr:hypothetical protein [Sideroxydans sp.]
MSSPELFIISTLKALVEIAALSLLAQGMVGIFAGPDRQQNLFYKLFQTITRPVIKGVRRITPHLIADNYLPLVTFFILFWLWIALIYAKASVCHAQQLACFAN